MPSDHVRLILTPFVKAVRSLEEIFEHPKTVIVRDAAIQRFEYTFELAIKLLKRFLETTPSGSEVDQLTYRDLCRMAAEVGLIVDPETWFMYRDARNLTSHTYNEIDAERVYETAKRFAKAARQLLERLEQRL